MRLAAPQPPETRPFDFLAVGENSLDEICLTTGVPSAGSKSELLRRVSLPGGQAMTAAIGVSRLGFRSRYVGAIGDDAAGSAIRAALEADRTDSQLVAQPGVATRSALVIIDAQGGRSVLESRDPRLNIGHEIDDDVFRSARIVLVDATDVALAARAAGVARASGAKTMCDVDTVTPKTLDLLKLIDVVIVPAEFAEHATGRDQLGPALSELGRNSGATAVVATEGSDGATAWCDGQLVHVPAIPVEVVDTTGAGDAFRAGFAVAWLKAGPGGGDLERMLRFACRVAALKCRSLGAQTGLPTAAELAGSKDPDSDSNAGSEDPASEHPAAKSRASGRGEGRV